MSERIARAIGTFSTLTHCRRGATAVEYGLIVGLIAVVIMATVWEIGTAMGGNFSSLNDIIRTALGG